MASPKFVASQCPTCGASLPVPPGVPQVTCRYCRNVIHVELRKPPPEVRPFGTPGAVVSTTVYIDPAAAEAAAKAGKSAGCALAIGILVPILLPILIVGGPAAVRGIKRTVKPFPISCGINEEVTVSGNHEVNGPLITSVGSLCKIRIKDAKLKGTTLANIDGQTLDLVLERVTLETTDTMIHAGSNTKLKIIGSTLTSPGPVVDVDTNLQIDLEGSTLESKNAAVVKTKHNLKVKMDNAKVRGKKAGFDTDANFTLTMKKGSEITSSDGPAVKTTSSFKLDADGGKIDGGLVLTSGARIEVTGLAITAKEKAITGTSGLTLDFTDGSITSSGDTAIDTDSSLDLTLVNTTVQGATTGVNCESSSKIRASKKSRIIGLQGFGVAASSSGAELNLADAAVEGGTQGFRGAHNNKVKLAQGSRVAGKKGGIAAEGNLEVDATGATLDGGSGPGIQAGYNARISFKQGTLKGAPALAFERKPSALDLDGTRVDGEQRIPAR